MEVHVKPEVQAKLDQLVRESGRPTDELLEEAIVGYFDEVNNTRQLLDGRYDDLENGNVKLIDGNEHACAQKVQRVFPAVRDGLRVSPEAANDIDREYVIAYAPAKTPLWVVAVFLGRRSPRVIAAMLRNREQ